MITSDSTDLEGSKYSPEESEGKDGSPLHIGSALWSLMSSSRAFRNKDRRRVQAISAPTSNGCRKSRGGSRPDAHSRTGRTGQYRHFVVSDPEIGFHLFYWLHIFIKHIFELHFLVMFMVSGSFYVQYNLSPNFCSYSKCSTSIPTYHFSFLFFKIVPLIFCGFHGFISLTRPSHNNEFNFTCIFLWITYRG